MSTELATVESHDLSLSSEQSFWNDRQLAALRHMGVEKATEGDLTVFHHVCVRTGLDPFARQIYMIGRNAREQVNGEWQYVTKYTIQTGIDGFRLIGRRAADRSRQSISLAAPEWAHEDGSWRPVWRSAWGTPVAARVILKRDGEPFEAVALFDEYKQTKRDGSLTQMWAQRPAGQIAKCAEALAWRMAFPQDLSGIYTDDEMGQADRTTPEAAPSAAQGTAADRMGALLSTPEREPVSADEERFVEPDGSVKPSDESPLLDTSSGLAKSMFAAMGDAGISDRDDRLAYVSATVGRTISSSKEMTDADAEAVIAALGEIAQGEIVEDQS